MIPLRLSLLLPVLLIGGSLPAVIFFKSATAADPPTTARRAPRGVSFSTDGTQILVHERGTETLAIIPVAEDTPPERRPAAGRGLISSSGQMLASPDGRWTALIDPWQTHLLIADVPPKQIDETALEKCRRIEIDPNPQALAITLDGTRILVACDPPGLADRVLCVVDVKTGEVTRRRIPGSSNLRGVAVDPTGSYALVTHLRPKSQLPSTQISQGWVFTNALSYVPLTGDGDIVSLPLDLRTEAFANPEGIVIAPDGRTAYVAHAGADLVSVLDLTRLKATVQEIPARASVGQLIDFDPRGDDLRLTRRYVSTRIPVGANPQTLALSPDGKLLAVANRLDDSISLIDTATHRVTRTILLSDRAADPVLEGERLFYSGRLAFEGQFSCASCHPDGTTDGLNWDLPADGFNNFHNTKTLLGITGTQPYGWLGESTTLRTRFVGTLRQLFQYEATEPEITALEAYLSQLDYPADLPTLKAADDPAVIRGEQIFRTTGDCIACHRGEAFADGAAHDIGHGEYDTPSLRHVSRTAPYLHDGRAATLQAIFAEHNTSAQHGNASSLTAEQLQDLVAYLQSL